LVFEKCLFPKKPRWAEKGEGWADFKIKCFSGWEINFSIS
jgi:hypothetical protein